MDARQSQGQTQSKGVRGHLLYNRKGSQEAVVQLLRRPRCFDVTRVQPDGVTDLKWWNRESTWGRVGLVLLEGVSDLVAEVLVEFLQVRSNSVSSIRHNSIKGNFEFRVKALVGKERGDHGGRMRGIVVCKLCKGQEVDPVVLLVVDVDPKILFQDLVDSFSLPVGLWVIGR